MKWYNVEIPYNTRETIKRADSFRIWLYDHNFEHEPSACGDMLHFEIYASENDVQAINNALDEIIWYDVIC